MAAVRELTRYRAFATSILQIDEDVISLCKLWSDGSKQTIQGYTQGRGRRQIRPVRKSLPIDHC